MARKVILLGLVLEMLLCSLVASVSARSSSGFQASVSELRRAQRDGEVVHRHHHPRSHSRKLSSLVETSPLLLSYHNGPILAGGSDSHIHVYIVWYGQFSDSQRAVVVDFFESFADGAVLGEPSVRTWWKGMESYTDAKGSSVSSQVLLKGQAFDQYSKGKTLSKEDIQDTVEQSVSSGAFPSDPKAIYYVLTADDVQVGTFCMNSCGSHQFTAPSEATANRQLLFAWVGNAGKKCAGLCAWPFSKPVYGPQTDPLVAPNGDVGVDGMIINIAIVLSGAATNPYSNAYFQGDASAPLEAATSCAGIYGEGAYPGYPGALLVDETTGASYNARGVNGRRFLLPAVWDPTSLSCRVPYSATIDLVVTDEIRPFSESQ